MKVQRQCRLFGKEDINCPYPFFYGSKLFAQSVNYLPLFRKHLIRKQTMDGWKAVAHQELPELPWEIISGCILPHAPMTLGMANWELYVTKDNYIHWVFGAGKRLYPTPAGSELDDCVNVDLRTFRKWVIDSRFVDAAFTHGILIRPPGERRTPLTVNKKWILIPSLTDIRLVYPTKNKHLGWQLNSIFPGYTMKDLQVIYWIDDWLLMRHYAPVDTVVQLFAECEWRSQRVVATEKISDETWNALAEFDVGLKSSLIEYANDKQDVTKRERVNVIRCDVSPKRTQNVEFIGQYLGVDVLSYNNSTKRELRWRAGAVLVNLLDQTLTTIVHKVPSGYFHPWEAIHDELNPFM